MFVDVFFFLIFVVIFWVFLLLFFSFFFLCRRRWSRKFNITSQNIICENHTFFWSLYPWSFRFYFNDFHGNLVKKFVTESRSNIWFLNRRQTEKEPGSNWSDERKDEFRENGAQSVFENKGKKFSIFFFLWLFCFLELTFDLFFESMGKEFKLIFCLSFVDSFVDGFYPFECLHNISSHDFC